MKFRVLKSSLDGICGGNSLLSVDEACREISYSKGWDSVAELHAAIRRWARNAKVGSIFCTAASAIVAGASGGHSDECPECLGEDIEWGELGPVEDGSIEQRAHCNQCGHHWNDIFVHSERQVLAKVSV